MNTEQARNSINYVIEDISRIRREMGQNAAIGQQAEDREAFEIVRRIERKLKGQIRKPKQSAG